VSAVPNNLPELGVMSDADLSEVVAIERAIYTHPWSEGNFADSLRAGYDCRTWRMRGELIGYFVLMSAAGEAHLLNLSVAGAHQRRGHGAALLREATRIAKSRGAHAIFLEVRPSNQVGQRLYTRFGFRRVGVRRDYYPAASGREDALVLSLAL
jgi:ribosomal-protein-alanine N-acetyltransferase